MNSDHAPVSNVSDEALRGEVWRALEDVPDPEMPINIVDLGLVERVEIDGDEVSIEILPTFIGCPALPMISQDIERKVGAIDGISRVLVSFVNDPPWNVDRITEPGRESLREFGITVPERGGLSSLKSGAPSSIRTAAAVEFRTSASPVTCPVCGSNDTHLDSPFGPTRCRVIYICSACNNQFEHMKKV